MGCGAGKPKKDPSGWSSDLEVFRRYEFTMVKGNGGVSQVHEALRKADGAPVAIKCLVRKEADKQNRCGDRKTATEQSWGLLDHPSVCRLHSVFQDDDLEYYVMDLCEGGTLFAHLEEEIVLEEPRAGSLAFQMISAVAHLHDKHLCHRDLKPESWLRLDCTPESSVKLINFDLATEFTSDFGLSQPCGTLHYLAPEVLRASYGPKADVWTLGVVLFLALYAVYPFDGDTIEGVMAAILGDAPDWTDSCYPLSPEAQDLLHKLLVKDPSERPTAKAAMQHRWVTSNGPRQPRGVMKQMRRISQLLVDRKSHRRSLAPRASTISSSPAGFDNQQHIHRKSALMDRRSHLASSGSGTAGLGLRRSVRVTSNLLDRSVRVGGLPWLSEHVPTGELKEAEGAELGVIP